MKKLFKIFAIVMLIVMISNGHEAHCEAPEGPTNEVYYELHTDHIVEVRRVDGHEERRELDCLFDGPWDPTDDFAEYPEDYPEESRIKTDKDYERNISSMLITYRFE